MTVEAPIQVDFNQDLASQGIQLSPEQQESFQAYLEGLREDEKQEIIYLTQQELVELQNIIGQEVSQPSQADFDEFIAGQQDEGLSMADIFEGNSQKLVELGESLDTYSEKFLFGDEGILNNLDLSDITKDNIITALSLAIFENVDIGKDFRGNIQNAFESLGENFTILHMLAKQDDALQIDGQGERNYIFADPAAGKNFFTELFSREMSSREIKDYIEERNLDDDSNVRIAPDISGLSAGIQEQVKKYMDFLRVEKQDGGTKIDSGSTTENTVSQDMNSSDVPSEEDIEEIKEKGGIFAAFAEFFENLLEGLKDFAENFSDNDTGEKTKKDTKKNEETKNEKTIQLINDLSPHNGYFVENLKNDPSSTKKIRELLEGISSEENYSETLTNFLSGESITNMKEVKAIDAFNEYGFGESFPEGMSDVEKVIKCLEEYSLYRNSPGVKNKQTERTTWEQWAQKRQKENWS